MTEVDGKMKEEAHPFLRLELAALELSPSSLSAAEKEEEELLGRVSGGVREEVMRVARGLVEGKLLQVLESDLGRRILGEDDDGSLAKSLEGSSSSSPPQSKFNRSLSNLLQVRTSSCLRDLGASGPLDSSFLAWGVTLIGAALLLLYSQESFTGPSLPEAEVKAHYPPPILRHLCSHLNSKAEGEEGGTQVWARMGELRAEDASLATAVDEAVREGLGGGGGGGEDEEEEEIEAVTKAEEKIKSGGKKDDASRLLVTALNFDGNEAYEHLAVPAWLLLSLRLLMRLVRPPGGAEPQGVTTDQRTIWDSTDSLVSTPWW